MAAGRQNEQRDTNVQESQVAHPPRDDQQREGRRQGQNQGRHSRDASLSNNLEKSSAASVPGGTGATVRSNSFTMPKRVSAAGRFSVSFDAFRTSTTSRLNRAARILQ